MAREGIPSAVLLDALGTLVELEAPWPHLARELAARGVVVDIEDARAAMLAEMAYYRAHHDEARDWAGLKDLRRRCAGVVQESPGHVAAAGRRRGSPAGGDPLPRLPRGARRARAPARRRRAPGRGLELGRLAARRPRAHRPARRSSTPSSSRPSSASPSPIRRSSAPRSSDWAPRPPRRCTSATASSTTSPARARRAWRRCSSPATARRRPTACASWPSLDGLLMT